jgi:hypothetical protein
VNPSVVHDEDAVGARERTHVGELTSYMRISKTSPISNWVSNSGQIRYFTLQQGYWIT